MVYYLLPDFLNASPVWKDANRDERDELTFASVALPDESPEQLRAVMAVGRLVEGLLDEAVSVLVAQVVVFHRAGDVNRSWQKSNLNLDIAFDESNCIALVMLSSHLQEGHRAGI